MDQGIQTKLLRRDEEEEEGDLKGRIWDESKKIWRVALPGVISRVCAFGTIVVTQSFIGHISGLDLAGYALVQTLCVRFVNGIVVSLSLQLLAFKLNGYMWVPSHVVVYAFPPQT